ncbi:MAG: bifunctional glutamate N-acetyltransferase/amino-acid acetyltransferase ArgJ [Dehalococcoidales bacterium]|nr:bifunctional glutamate N-acetyltransferase/amino-acid acetyltransferase ArgJ [Dehalococcoidales bacterium]
MTKAEISFLNQGTITTPAGFLAGVTHAGLKKNGAADLGILYSEAPCVAAGVFTANRIKAAPVVVTSKRLPSEAARAIVVNSGCANASLGEAGLKDAAKMAELAAGKTDVPVESVLVASTGVIGRRLPMELIGAGIAKISLSKDGGHELARAIMTTDTRPKEAAVTVRDSDGGFTIGGIAKGSGMIHPDLATLLCFLATDAAVSIDFLKCALKEAVAVSFNMVSVDGDTSPNDMALIMANGRAGNEPITGGSNLTEGFREALKELCIHLAKGIAADGEGASKLITVTVSGAISPEEAKLAARTIAASPLVKTAVHGSDPNWGRVIAALGRSGAEVVEERIDLYIGDTCLVRAGLPLPFDEREVIKVLDSQEVPIKVSLNLGTASATAWGCDLSREYVTINSDYTT